MTLTQKVYMKVSSKINVANFSSYNCSYNKLYKDQNPKVLVLNQCSLVTTLLKYKAYKNILFQKKIKNIYLYTLTSTF